ncbi:MAG: PIG-L family deacetylase, partial [Kiritimatiellae bacterium]|nr:PIG-L family deacetylase [Kiritimatiellia bacterium]
MEMNRRGFLGLGKGLVAATATAGAMTTIAAEPQQPRRKRTFVGACPPSSREYGGRRPGPTRVMVIGAHPDDADIVCGCTAVKLIERGFSVRFVSITDGRMGHHKLTPDETARTRRAE